MEQEAFDSIIRRNRALRKLLGRISQSRSVANTNAPFMVLLSIETIESNFMSAYHCSVDGDSAHFRTHDGTQEARQVVCLLAFDRNHRLVGLVGWPSGKRITPEEAIQAGGIDRASVGLLVVLTHREWFNRGELPIGVPYPDNVPKGLLRTEIILNAFGECGIPSPWLRRIRD